MSIRIGVICPSEIAFRRFIPSLKRVSGFEYIGVAIATAEEWSGSGDVTSKTLTAIENERSKAMSFVEAYGGKIFEGYENLIRSNEIDAVYLPLPPALHYKWAKCVLENGKHAYVEKPFTTNLAHTRELIDIARDNGLALHENYMFVFHDQIKAVDDIISSGEIGKVWQYRISFGFPYRGSSDFRYNKALGGGSLLDAGGYCIRYASHLLGESARFLCSHLYTIDADGVDMFGSATMINDEGTIVQFSFGMDHDYKCELEAWGSKGTLTTGRILTAADGFVPRVYIKHNQELIERELPADNAFEKSISRFYECLTDPDVRFDNYKIIEHQAILLDGFLSTYSNGK